MWVLLFCTSFKLWPDFMEWAMTPLLSTRTKVVTHKHTHRSSLTFELWWSAAEQNHRPFFTVCKYINLKTESCMLYNLFQVCVFQVNRWPGCRFLFPFETEHLKMLFFFLFINLFFVIKSWFIKKKELETPERNVLTEVCTSKKTFVSKAPRPTKAYSFKILIFGALIWI